MRNQQNLTKRDDLIQLHASTCYAMTQFINGRHCPKLAHFIVQRLSLLLSHPELTLVTSSREMYQQLLEHWQLVTKQLLEQKNSVALESKHYH